MTQELKNSRGSLYNRENNNNKKTLQIQGKFDLVITALIQVSNYKLSEQDGWCSKSCRQRTLPNNPLFLYNVIHKLAKSLLLGMPKTSSQHTYTLYHKKTLMGLVYISHSRNVIVFLQCKHFIWSCRENIYCVACRKGKQTHLNRQIKRVLELITTIHYPLLYSLS